MSIETNLNKIKSEIEKACSKCGRSPNDVKIVAVTKTRTAEEINEVIALGINNLGENRVQEFNEKYAMVSSKAVWHIIGHLQTNKVKYIADKVSMIHSVDSFKLAKEIDKHCTALGKCMDILIEVNSGEENKGGVPYSQACSLVEQVSELKGVHIKGLMTMAPLGASEDVLRKVFSGLRKLASAIDEKNYENVCMTELSMGMSGDYAIAVEEGATIIRPGRTLFNV